MFEKVNPSHPDKLADRIAGAIVDLAYELNDSPHIAVEAMNAGYNVYLVIETDTALSHEAIERIVRRISPEAVHISIQIRPQDSHLHDNQQGEIRCGDNGIFRGCPITTEQRQLTDYMGEVYEVLPYDGKALIDRGEIALCQSHTDGTEDVLKRANILNPLGPWTGGPSVDTGATNRKLGSDLGEAITGGGIHGKDLSKADVSVTVFLHMLAQEQDHVFSAVCAIGDKQVDITDETTGHEYYADFSEIVDVVADYIDRIGGFEALATWGLIRPEEDTCKSK